MAIMTYLGRCNCQDNCLCSTARELKIVRDVAPYIAHRSLVSLCEYCIQNQHRPIEPNSPAAYARPISTEGFLN
jgi:hypothetical protein